MKHLQRLLKVAENMSIQLVVNPTTIESILRGLCIQHPHKIGITFTFPRSNRNDETTWRFHHEILHLKILCNSQGFMWYHPQKKAYVEVLSHTLPISLIYAIHYSLLYQKDDSSNDSSISSLLSFLPPCIPEIITSVDDFTRKRGENKDRSSIRKRTFSSMNKDQFTAVSGIVQNCTTTRLIDFVLLQ